MTATAGARLRRQLVSDLEAKGALRSERVRDAFLSVPRERFLAQVERGLHEIYKDEAIVTKRDAQGMPRSSSSQPSLMAEMLEQLDVQPGQRVLEIGAGTGYNAALLAHIVGRRGRVTSIDVDAELARRARRCLREAGYSAAIKVGDGRNGHPDGAPYDRIIVTACADEVPNAWLEQLAEGGRLELPLRLDPDGAAIQVIPTLERRGEDLRSTGLTWGGFMPLHRGDGGWRPPSAALGVSRQAKGQPTMLASVSGAGVEQLSGEGARRLLAAILTRAGTPRRSGMTDLSGSRPPLVLLYLMLNIPASRRVSVTQDGRLGIGVIHPRRQSLALVSLRTPWQSGADSRARWRLDAYGEDDAAAAELNDLLDQWERLRRAGRTKLELTAQGPGDPLELSFNWARD